MTQNSQMSPAPRRSADASSVEEIDRGSIRVIPEGSIEIQPPPMLMNSAPWRIIWGFGLLAIVELAMNAGAGAAAAKVGSDLNGVTPTTLAIRMGALAGLTKAALTTFREIVLMNGVNFGFRMLLFLITSSIGICPLLVTEVGNIVLGETPKELVIAGVVAAFPLFFESIRDIKPKPDDDGRINYYRWVYAVFLIGTDALGGYVFARMASNQGMPVSNYKAACSAGAVYGTLTFVSRAITGCVAMIQNKSEGIVSDIFGVWEVVLPDKIVVTEEEYRQMQDGLAKLLTQFFSSGTRGLGSMLTCCCCCFPRGRRWAKGVREDMFDSEIEGDVGFMGVQLAQSMLPTKTVNAQHRTESV
ncbi:uncharacterized protein CTRU02_211835 [Colletotrichum truncatum]|uniref:Uncharacterized protein n=1 Tax=Colletotrichum truncatum TaxID=5467 RepID=A0ACC3YM46_COLTU|nr:uncharacterized protein CTRU02_07243 [Colletotrichum truncatum]KAF6791481.1 hypothetical protein CTRU02_07243 [Colletotrichum truncatum]